MPTMSQSNVALLLWRSPLNLSVHVNASFVCCRKACQATQLQLVASFLHTDERHHIKDTNHFLWQAQHTSILCIFPVIKVVEADHRAISFFVFRETDTRICHTNPSSHRWPCYTPMWFVHSCIRRISFPHWGCQSLTVALNYHIQGSALHARGTHERGPVFTHLWLKTERGLWPIYLEFSATNLLCVTRWRQQLINNLKSVLRRK